MAKPAPYVLRPLLINPKGLDRWRAALADANTVVPSIFAVGHSIVYGGQWDGNPSSGPDNLADINAWAGRLRTRFARHFGNANEAGYIATKPIVSDTRVSTSGSPTSSFGGFRQILSLNNTGPKSVTITLPASTAFDVLYYDGDGTGGQPTGGNFSVNTDGAGAVAVNHAAGGGYKAASFTGLANTTHSVVITGTSSTSVLICGVRYYSDRGVCVCRFGHSGWTTQDSLGIGGNNVGTASQQARELASYGMGTPKLVIIEWLTNDWQLQVDPTQLTTPTLYRAGLQQMIDVSVAAGASVLLLSDTDPPYGNPGGGTFNWTDYDNVLRGLAGGVNPHVAYASIADIFGPNANAIALGLQNGGSVHPTRAGYSDVGNHLFQLLTQRFLPLT